ncbi:MAG: matrixin family metalloprotease [Nitrososphaera sp.]|uniref:matrixin family metalloprotease n=1 Tax=Nitrososphaera sp. TaxID=1971748 RepID=UPI00183BDD50|nr:matrixin family metalloprotease [Nitrososphaera sp.]NWG36854.1 matrixin family metalloprotease [Nitrososphaera sp.]
MLRLALAASLFVSLFFMPAFAATYYEEQTDFDEHSVPEAGYRWDRQSLQVCISKEDGVPNKYYVWSKLAVQDWRSALREYTGDADAWSMSARYAPDGAMAGCDVRVHIYDTYKDFPGYPDQKGAYTAVQYTGGISDEADVYLSPKVLHGDGSTEIDLPGYAFRNSAVHEMGHVLGLSHNAKIKGYLMSPQFDFWEEDDQLPITTMELSTLAEIYGSRGLAG